MAKTITTHRQIAENTSKYLDRLCETDEFKDSTYPGVEKDKLFKPTYRHKHRKPQVCSECNNCIKEDDRICEEATMLTCDDLKCDDAELVDRDLKTETRKLRIHVGRMASGDSHMVSHRHRDKLAKE